MVREALFVEIVLENPSCTDVTPVPLFLSPRGVLSIARVTIAIAGLAPVRSADVRAARTRDQRQTIKDLSERTTVAGALGSPAREAFGCPERLPSD
jgi:hypothetical protein